MIITKNPETILAALEYIYSPMDCYKPKKIIHNGPAVIVLWKDNTKTVVKISEADFFYSPYNESEFIYYGFCCALAKKIFATNSNLKRAIKEATVTNKEKK